MSTKKILVVDDNSIVVKALQIKLAEAGFLEAFDLLLGHRFISDPGRAVEVNCNLFDFLLDTPLQGIEELEVAGLVTGRDHRLGQPFRLHRQQQARLHQGRDCEELPR